MGDVFTATLGAAQWMPHGYCLQWQVGLVATLVVADGVTAASYFSIPFTLWFFARKRPDVAHRWLLVLFGLFVMACGATHVLDVINVWRASYVADAGARVMTAVLSLTTAIVLWRIMPMALKAPSARQLEASNQKLRESYQYARSLIEASLDPLVTIGADGRILDVNEATEQATGCVRERLIGSDFSDYFTEPQRARAGYQEAYATGRVIDFPLAIRHSSGSVTPVLYNASVYRDEAGRVAGVFAAARDISGLQRAEERLELANRELEAFSYSVAHDLRAPLRGIDGWSLALMEDYREQLDATAQGYIDLVRAETQRMGGLIDDLLLLSRVTRQELRHESLDLSALARTVADRLLQAQPARQIEFTIQPGVRVEGDARLLEIALTNLLENAFKFTQPRPVACIAFGCDETQRAGTVRRVYFVRDNGVGFDMAHADKLGDPFHRLHKTSEFPGTGIGLATVQRIVRRHRGQLWAEAVPDRGATLYFTLGAEA